MSISEGGLGLQTTAPVEQGEPLRLRFPAQGRLPETEIEVLVWYDHPISRSRGQRGLRFVGCVVPDRAQSFLDLFAEVERRYGPAQRPAPAARRRPTAPPSPASAPASPPSPASASAAPPRRRAEDDERRLHIEHHEPRLRPEDGDLPHPRDPLPPPKPEPEETQPRFRVRLRQVGGPRSRCVTIAACSMAQAAERARVEAESRGAASWAVLEVTLDEDEAASRR